jgi:hypothetical protein
MEINLIDAYMKFNNQRVIWKTYNLHKIYYDEKIAYDIFSHGPFQDKTKVFLNSFHAVIDLNLVIPL